VFGYRVWPGILLGALLVSPMQSWSGPTPLVVAAGNTIEGLAGAWLIRRFAGGARFYERPLDVLRFVALIGMTCLISPPVGAQGFHAGDVSTWLGSAMRAFTWWLGDMVSLLAVTPLLVAWSLEPRRAWSRAQAIELGLLFLLLILTAQAVFGNVVPASLENYLLPHLCLPFILWAAFRFGARETTAAMFILGASALWATLHGEGPFGKAGEHRNLVLITCQAFIAIYAVTALAVAAVVSERRRGDLARLHLLRRLEDAQETERGRIARELHDQLGQELAALKLGLQVVRKQGSALPAAVQRCVGQLEDLSDSLMRNLHRLAVELRPAALDDFGLDLALRRYADEWSEQSGVRVDFHSKGVEDRLPRGVESMLYRVAQEALTNVFRHAQARHVSVLLERRAGQVSLIVEDDGSGFDAETVMKAPAEEGRLGLLSMQERVALAGGTFDLESTPGAGTTVFVRVPLEPEPAPGTASTSPSPGLPTPARVRQPATPPAKPALGPSTEHP
jgi:signal transduction histidine kinase